MSVPVDSFSSIPVPMLSAPTQQQQQLDDGATRRTLALASRRLRHSVAGSAPTSPELGRKRKMGNKGVYAYHVIQLFGLSSIQ